MEKILAELSTCTSEEVTFGKTKIFIKSPKTVSWSVTCIRWGWESWRAHLHERLGGEGSFYNLERIADEEVSSLPDCSLGSHPD